MARGGARPGAGRPVGVSVGKVKKINIKAAAKKAGVSPLDFMLAVMNDDDEDMKLRAQMAVAAAPYVHAKVEAAQKGKKEERQDAAEKAASKFAPPSPPKLVVNNGR